jgi:ATP-binding cassette subfamily B protein
VSTIRDADQIVVLDEGRLAGVGKHDELVRTCPAYRAIVESQQMEGGEADGE